MISISSSIYTIPNLYILVVLFLTSVAFQYWSDGLRLLAITLGVFLPMIVCKSYFSTRQFYYLVFYFIIVLLNHITGDTYFKETYGLIMNATGLFVSSSLIYYIINTKNYKLLQAIVLVVFFIIIWTAIATAFFDFSIPGIVRRAVNMKREGQGADLIGFYRYGMAEYASVHAIPILIPPLVFGIKKSERKMQKVLYSLLLILCFMLVYFSAATGPMIVALGIIFISFIVRSGNISSNLFVFFLLFLFLIFIVNDSMMLWLLDGIDNLIGYEGYFHEKIIDFEDSIIYGESSGDLEGRMDLYEQTTKSISESFLFGTQSAVGGHSALLDRLASLGIVGMIPFVGFLIVEFRTIKKYIPSNGYIYFILSWISALVMLLTKNNSGWHMWFYLITVLPLLLFFIDSNYAPIRRSKKR